jgi:autotransporter-associated beta strand protein
VVSGTAALVKLGASELTLSGVNTFSGPTTVDFGTLTLAGGSALANSMVVTLGAAGTLKLASNEEIASLAGGGLVNVQGSTLTLSGTNSTTLTAELIGWGGLEQKGLGANLLLSNPNNNFTGAVLLTAGTVTLGHNDAFGIGGPVIFLGGTLAYSAGMTTDLSARIAPIGLGVTAYVDTNAGSTVTYATGLTGDGGFNKLGGGTLVFTGDSLYTGTTTITAGTLVLGAGGTSGSVAGAIVLNGTLAVNRSDDPFRRPCRCRPG